MNSKTEQILKDAIIETLNTRGAMKGTELATTVLSKLYPSTVFSSNEFVDFLTELTAKGEVIELEYVRPDMRDRIKSIYFPKETQLFYNNNWLTKNPTGTF